MTIWGVRKRGFRVFWISPRRTASGSSSPRLPTVSLRRPSFSRSACSRSGLAVGVISERLTDMEALGEAVIAPTGRPPVDCGAAPSHGAMRCGLPTCHSAQEQSVDRIVGFVLAGIREPLDERAEGLLVGARHLQADQNAPVVGALVAVVEQADVPVRMHALEETHQCAGPLGEHEAIEPL